MIVIDDYKICKMTEFSMFCFVNLAIFKSSNFLGKSTKLKTPASKRLIKDINDRHYKKFAWPMLKADQCWPGYSNSIDNL